MSEEKKIKQIAVAGTVENGATQSEAMILALCEDGSLYWMTNREIGTGQWKEMSTPQQEDT